MKLLDDIKIWRYLSQISVYRNLHCRSEGTLINKIKFIYILINTNYLIYKIINSKFIRKTNLKYINIPTKKLIEMKEKENQINKMIKTEININKYQ